MRLLKEQDRGSAPLKRDFRGAAGRMPHGLTPMLATLVDAPFDRAGWLFEPKWDGYRAIAEVSAGRVRLLSRKGKPFNERFAPVAQALATLRHEAVLDGEVVALDERGRSRFQLLQNYQRTGEGTLVYYVFDLLYLDGHDLRGWALSRRKAMLSKILGHLPGVRLSEHVEQRGKAFYRTVAEEGLEGMMAKNAASRYLAGMRSDEWLKVKVRRRQEAVIGGFTEPRGGRKGLGALVLGVYEGKRLTFIGHMGGGLGVQGLADLRRRLIPLVRDTSPFVDPPTTNAPVHWVKPVLVCEAEFQEWTEDGRMRQPVFVGLREDKPARLVRREREQGVGKVVRRAESGRGRRLARRNDPGSLLLRSMESAERRGSEKLPAGPVLTNLSKVYWPDEGITKGELVSYYRAVAPVILPHLCDRPLSLHRHPGGIRGPSFFQKDVGRQPPPPWVETARVRSEGDGKTVTYVVCQDEASLLYVANLGCIELNPWLSRLTRPDRPDYLVIDLDPDDLPFDVVVEAAQAVRRLLDHAGAPNLCKTSGKRGLHICVPLGARYHYDQAQGFAELVANLVREQLPETTSVERRPAQRRGRVYLDFLQNRRGQTLAAPYSVRPWPGATVSTPLRWSEVRRGLNPARFTIATVPRRLARLGDLWEPIQGEGADLAKCLKRLRPGHPPGLSRRARGR